MRCPRSVLAGVAMLGLLADAAAQTGSVLVPQGAAFLHVLQHFDYHGPPEDGPGVAILRAEMGLEELEAKDFAYRLTRTFAQLREELRGLDWRLVCSATPRPRGRDIYRALHDIIDRRLAVAEERLQLLKKDIGTITSAHFERWLERQQPDERYWKINYAERVERNGMTPDEFLERICADE